MNRLIDDEMAQHMSEAIDPVEAEATLSSIEQPPDDEGLVDAMMDYVGRETAHVDPFPSGDGG